MNKQDKFYTRYYAQLVKLRKEFNLSIEYIAEMAEVSKNTIYRMENGDKISLDSYDKICQAYANEGCLELGKEKFIKEYGEFFKTYMEEK